MEWVNLVMWLVVGTWFSEHLYCTDSALNVNVNVIVPDRRIPSELSQDLRDCPLRIILLTAL